jgi:hypothetical protein
MLRRAGARRQSGIFRFMSSSNDLLRSCIHALARGPDNFAHFPTDFTFVFYTQLCLASSFAYVSVISRQRPALTVFLFAS